MKHPCSGVILAGGLSTRYGGENKAFLVRSSLTGVHAGLFYTRHPFAFFSACDTPFLKKEIIETVLEQIDPADDLIIPQTSKGFEPLCAAYSKRCLKAAEEHLRANKLKIQLALQKGRIKTIPEERLREKDPELVSFFNVNTPEDLARAEQMLTAGSATEG
ncbi:MAG: molybdenum cofactor guanylyltransferase [Desulfobacterales bacterium]|nr:molybdenum cofactor guanylyltransferase [Desulfobacterales bacterium]